MANGEEKKLQSAEERIAQLEFDVEVLKSAVLRACHAAEPAWSKLDAVDVFWKSVRPSAGPTPFGMAEFVVGEVRSVDYHQMLAGTDQGPQYSLIASWLKSLNCTVCNTIIPYDRSQFQQDSKSPGVVEPSTWTDEAWETFKNFGPYTEPDEVAAEILNEKE